MGMCLGSDKQPFSALSIQHAAWRHRPARGNSNDVIRRTMLHYRPATQQRVVGDVGYLLPCPRLPGCAERREAQRCSLDNRAVVQGPSMRYESPMNFLPAKELGRIKTDMLGAVQPRTCQQESARHQDQIAPSSIQKQE